MKTYSIFLASSNELDTERVKFGNFIRWVSDSYKNKNVEFKLEVWEDMDSAFNKKSKQGDYNDRLKEAEIVIVFFWTKMGKWTLKEFELAYQLYNNSGTDRPLVYVYEKLTSPDDWKPTKEDIESKAKFKKRLLTEEKEQFHCTFNDFKALENHFLKTLHGLFANNVLTYGERAKMLSPNGPIAPNPFLGRQRELKTLEERFEKSPQTLLIHAEGGMGKTTLASKYWYDSEYRYSHQAWLFCDQGIMDALKTLVPNLGLDRAFNALGEADQIATLKTIISNLDGDFLLVLDNANEAGHIREFLQQFRGFKWNVLITSRCREVLKTADEINLSHLDPEDAKTLFRNFYSEETEEFGDLLDRMLKGINYHTLLTEVFSKNLRKASSRGIGLKSFLERFEEKGIILDSISNTKVETDYTFHINKELASPNEILEALYDFSKLTENERYYLVNMSLLPVENYKLLLLKELFGPEDEVLFFETMESLFQSGWVGGASNQYRLSPIIQQLVIQKNKETLWEDGKEYVNMLNSLTKFETGNSNSPINLKWIPYLGHLVNVFKGRSGYDTNLLLNKYVYLLSIADRQHALNEGKEKLEKALVSFVNDYGENSWIVAIFRSNLASILQDLGGEKNLLEAKGLLEKAITAEMLNNGKYSRDVSNQISGLATILYDLGGEKNLLTAKELLESALISAIHNFGEPSPQVSKIRSILSYIFLALGGEVNLFKGKKHLKRL